MVSDRSNGGNWLFLAALAGLAALFITFGLGLMLGASNNTQEEGYPRYRYASDKPQEINSAALRKANAKALEYRRPCQNPKGEGESELCAEWRSAQAGKDSALWTKWGVIVAGFGVAGLLVTIAQSSLALTKAREANRIALHATRPWLGVELKSIVQVQFSEGPPPRASGDVKVIATNHGDSPALNPAIAYRFVNSPHGVISKMEEIALDLQTQDAAQYPAIFPDDGKSIGRGWAITPIEEKGAALISLRNFSISRFSLYVVVIYESPSGGFHFTGDAFQLIPVDETTPIKLYKPLRLPNYSKMS